MELPSGQGATEQKPEPGPVRIQFLWPPVDKKVHLEGMNVEVNMTTSGKGIYTPPPLDRCSGDDPVANTVRDNLAEIVKLYPIRSWKVYIVTEGETPGPKSSTSLKQERLVKEILREFYVRPGARIGTFVTTLNPSRYKKTPGSRGVGPSEDAPYWATQQLNGRVEG